MSESAPLKWIELDRKISPTTAATNFFKALKKERDAHNLPTYNLGQGRERLPIPLLVQLVKAELTKPDAAEDMVSAEYNGAFAALQEASAAWIKRILNVDTSKDTTFPTQTNGRADLDESFWLMAKLAHYPRDGKILVPDTSWPMVCDLADDYGLQPAFYSMERGRYAENIRTQLAEHGDSIVGVYVNSPHNPTGQILTADDFHQIFAVLNEYNSPEHVARRGYKIGLVMDNPYPQSCPEVIREGVRGLNVGLEAFTQDQITPWTMPISASKFFGTARPGFTMLAAHKDYAKLLGSRLTRDSKSISYVPAFFRALTTLLSPQNHDVVMDWLAGLRDKYARNFPVFKAALGSRAIDGDAGMIGLAKLDPVDLIGQVVRRHDTSEFTIKDANDALEYIGNTQGVVAVNNGLDRHDNSWLFRFAFAELPLACAEGIAAFVRGLKEIAPILQAKLGAVPDPRPAQS